MTDNNNDTNNTTDSDNDTVAEKKVPLWVMLAFSSIHKRKHALMLIWASVIFSLYCIPFVNFTDNKLVSSLFLIDDWSWIAIMIPICIWYILCLRWMDNNNAWQGF